MDAVAPVVAAGTGTRAAASSAAESIAPVVAAGAGGVPRRVATAPDFAAELLDNDYQATVAELRARYLGDQNLGDTLIDAAAQTGGAVAYPAMGGPTRRVSPRSLADTLAKTAQQVGATADFAAGRAQRRPTTPAFPNAILQEGTPVGHVSIPDTVPPSQNTQRPEGSSARVTGPMQPDARRDLVSQLREAAAKSAPGVLNRLDRAFAPGEQISARDAALLAEAEGLPGKTYAQIAQGESNLTPNIVGTDPGGTHGLGLWQMTPGVQSRETKKAWDQIAKQHEGGYFNPVAAAEMAKLIAGEGTGVSNYYGTGFVTDPDAHLRGGEAAAEQRLEGDPRPIPAPLRAEAEDVLGAKRAQQVIRRGRQGPAPGSDFDPNRRQLSTDELFYDPGTSLVDNQPTASIGGHDTHVHFGSESQRSLLRAAKIAQNLGLEPHENPLFETVDPVHTEGSMHYDEEQLNPKLRDLARKLGGTGNVIGSAIDVAGDPASLARYDARLAKLSGAPLTTAGTDGTGTALSTGPAPGDTSAQVAQGMGLPVSSGAAGRGAMPTFSAPAMSPLAARPVLPGEYGGPGAQQDFESLLSGSGDASELATKLERFRPSRRL